MIANISPTATGKIQVSASHTRMPTLTYIMDIANTLAFTGMIPNSFHARAVAPNRGWLYSQS